MGSSNSKKVVTTSLMHCTLWKTDRSPPCRAVMMALDAMNLSLNEVDVNLDTGEHREPELNFFNPQNTLPIFRDRALILSDSHAITLYLASRYCNPGFFVPRDPKGRAKIDLLMHYDSSILYPRYRAAAYPILCGYYKCVMPQQVCEIECAYRDLECMLVGRNWLGGCCPSLGDVTIAATLSTLNIMIPIDDQRYPRLCGWLNQISKEMYYKTANRKGLCEFANRLERGCACVRVLNDGKVKEVCPRSSLMRRAAVPEENLKKIK